MRTMRRRAPTLRQRAVGGFPVAKRRISAGSARRVVVHMACLSGCPVRAHNRLLSQAICHTRSGGAVMIADAVIDVCLAISASLCPCA